ncbi:MAG: efflux RND transporter permease subunit [Proteobacteria bacterium]|nr:efflux RND transporter permease subunit [Pseudomonadota bacterium]
MNTPMPSYNPGGPIAWMASNPVAANIFLAVLILGGLIIGPRVKQEVFPEFDMGIVTVSVAYPGASPDEVESGIILAIEEAVQNIEGIDEIRSSASEGHGTVAIEAIEGIDISLMSREVEREINAITTFPEDAEDPKVTTSGHRHEVISYAIYGNLDDIILSERAEELRDTLLAHPMITQVDISETRGHEIRIEIPQETLRRYGLSISDIAGRIKNASMDLPGGSLKTNGGEILVRMNERKELAREYGLIPVFTYEDGSRILLRDMAVIREGFSDSVQSSYFNGSPAVIIEVYRTGDQKPIEIADAVKSVMNVYQTGLPEGIHVGMVRDSSEIFKQRADLLTTNAYIGLALVFILLAMFLSMRLSFWVSMGIPASILGSFLFLPLFGFSINMISMFAFIVTLGIVVDDAIVVGENIFYNRQQGMPFLQASIHGAREIAVPVCFSILTNIVAFIPLFFVPGFMGKVFRSIPLVVIAVLSISLFESLFILPAHLGHERKSDSRKNDGTKERKSFSKAFTSFVENRYGPFIAMAVRHRYLVFALSLSFLVITFGFIKSGRMGMELFPKVESDYAYVTATLPYGSSEKSVRVVHDKLVKSAHDVIEKYGKDRLSRGLLTRINENVITARLILTPPKERPVSTQVVTDAWRERTGPLSGIESVAFQSDRGGPGSGKGLTIELSHRDTGILQTASEELAEAMAEFPNATDIDDGSASGKRQYDFTLLPLGERLGFQASDVARQIRNAFYGAEARRLQRGRNEVKVMVRLPEYERVTEHTLETLILTSPKGNEALLSEIVHLEKGRAYTAIERRDGKRISSVTADINPRPKAGLIVEELKAGRLPDLTNKYPGLSYSFQGRQADMQESVTSLIRGLLMALLAIFCLLAIPLKSYIQPVLIMSCIPFGLVGAVLGHMMLGYSLSVMSLFGLVALSGVVVNDSLVLIDYTNRKVASGLPLEQAVQAAGIHRFRPIILTTLTTFGGLSPMIFETSRQAKFLIPMAVSLGFGIMFATVITLVLVPVQYMILEDIKGLFGASRK